MNGFLFAAYVVIWTVLFLYLFHLTRRQKQVTKELESLSKKLRENGK